MCLPNPLNDEYDFTGLPHKSFSFIFSAGLRGSSLFATKRQADRVWCPIAAWGKKLRLWELYHCNLATSLKSLGPTLWLQGFLAGIVDNERENGVKSWRGPSGTRPTFHVAVLSPFSHTASRAIRQKARNNVKVRDRSYMYYVQDTHDLNTNDVKTYLKFVLMFRF